MTARTDNRGYSYPECTPPLVKDRSDIGFLRDLAEQVNTDAGLIEFTLQEFLEKPDAARIAFGGSIDTTTTATDFTGRVPYDTVTYDNTAGSTDLGANALRPIEKGWYLFTSTLRCTNGGNQFMMLRHLRNGRAGTVRRFEGPSFPINGNEENMACSDMLRMEAGDSVQTQFLTSGTGGSYTFEGRLTMIQLYKLDV